MAQFDKPLVGIVGVVGRDPEIKSTSAGEVTEFSVAVSDGFGEGATTTWFRVSVWNEGLQASVQAPRNEGGLYKGAHVAVQGTVNERDGYGPDMKAVRVSAPLTWLDRSKHGQSAPAPVALQDDDGDF